MALHPQLQQVFAGGLVLQEKQGFVHFKRSYKAMPQLRPSSGSWPADLKGDGAQRNYKLPLTPAGRP